MLQLEDGWEAKGCGGWGSTGKTTPLGSNQVDVCVKWTYASAQSMSPLILSIPYQGWVFTIPWSCSL